MVGQKLSAIREKEGIVNLLVHCILHSLKA